jgi:hypothetical protein
MVVAIRPFLARAAARPGGDRRDKPLSLKRSSLKPSSLKSSRLKPSSPIDLSTRQDTGEAIFAPPLPQRGQGQAHCAPW